MDEQKVRLDEALKMNQLRENRLQAGDSDDSTTDSSSSDSKASTFKVNKEYTNSTDPPPLRAPPSGKWYVVKIFIIEID